MGTCSKAWQKAEGAEIQTVQEGDVRQGWVEGWQQPDLVDPPGPCFRFGFSSKSKTGWEVAM